MIKKVLLIVFLWCISVSAIAQNAPRRYAKLVPDGSGGFRAIYLLDTLSTTVHLNKKLDTISAAFYQIKDSLLTSPDSDIPGQYFYGSLRNSFSEKHQLSISYFIRPNTFKDYTLNPILNKTNYLLSLVDSTDVEKRDSILNSEYKRFISFLLTKNILSTKDRCFSKETAISCGNYDKKILNADSVIIIQHIAPPYGTCAIGLNKSVIIYKKNIGYIALGYGLVTDWHRKISFQEASDLLYALIKQTWGIIRFDKE